MIILFFLFICEDWKKLLSRICGPFFKFYSEKCPQDTEDADVSELCGSTPPHSVRCPVCHFAPKQDGVERASVTRRGSLSQNESHHRCLPSSHCLVGQTKAEFLANQPTLLSACNVIWLIFQCVIMSWFNFTLGTISWILNLITNKLQLSIQTQNLHLTAAVRNQTHTACQRCKLHLGWFSLPNHKGGDGGKNLMDLVPSAFQFNWSNEVPLHSTQC